MGCSSQKNAELDESSNDNTHNKKSKHDKINTDKNINEEGSGEEEEGEEEEEEEGKNEGEEEEKEMDKENKDKDKDNTIEKLEKLYMQHEYYFYPTKDIPKNKFTKKNIENLLPSDYANKETNKKDKQYLCFAKNKKKKKILVPEDESAKSNLINDDIYLFNLRMKEVKSVRPLKREEIIKPYNYQIEYKCDDSGIIDKVSNKDKEKYEYLDMYPNGEGYKYISNEEERKEEKKKINIPKKTIDEKKIELIKKNDVNDIANIINKELKENGLVEDNQKKVQDNANDF